MRLPLLLFFFLTALAAPLLAKSPEEVVLDYFAKMKEKGIGKIADMMHPEELKKFRGMLAPVVGKVLEAAEDEDDEERELFGKFADPKNKKKMRAMDDVEFMNIFMDIVETTTPELIGAMKTAQVEAIGHVTEKEVSHVVVRMKMKIQTVEMETMGVISVKDHKGVPMMLLTGEMKGMAEALKQRGSDLD